MDNLIGSETVNTMFLSTLEATMDHTEVRPMLEEASELFEELSEAGVDYDDVTRGLEKEAVETFSTPTGSSWRRSRTGPRAGSLVVGG